MLYSFIPKQSEQEGRLLSWTFNIENWIFFVLQVNNTLRRETTKIWASCILELCPKCCLLSLFSSQYASELPIISTLVISICISTHAGNWCWKHEQRMSPKKNTVQKIIWHVMDLGLVMAIKCFWDFCVCFVFGTIDWLGGQTSSSVAHMAKLEEGNTSSNYSFLECEHLTCNWDRIGNYSSQIHQLSCTGKPGKIMYCDQLMVIDGFCERLLH
jgi:hypothetical protein